MPFTVVMSLPTAAWSPLYFAVSAAIAGPFFFFSASWHFTQPLDLNSVSSAEAGIEPANRPVTASAINARFMVSPWLKATPGTIPAVADMPA